MQASPPHDPLEALLAACQKERADLERLFDIVPAMICIADEEGRFLYLNREWEKTLGFSRQELMGRFVFDLLHPDDHAATKAEIERQLEGGIDLLITDVVMPGMSGKDLSDRLQARYPHIRTLFMSGYTAGAIAHRGVLEQDVAFVQKPFSREELAVKVRAALKRKDS